MFLPLSLIIGQFILILKFNITKLELPDTHFGRLYVSITNTDWQHIIINYKWNWL